MKISKKTYVKRVKKFATRQNDAWKKLNAFMDLFAMSERKRDALCEIIDNYIFLNDDIMNYAIKNDIDKKDFMCDIDNIQSEML